MVSSCQLHVVLAKALNSGDISIADDSALRVSRAAIWERVTGTPLVDWSLRDVFEVGC